MPVVIRVGKKANEKKVRLELNARQALNGDVMIFDHVFYNFIFKTLFPSHNSAKFASDAKGDYISSSFADLTSLGK